MSKEKEMLDKIKNEVGIVHPMHEWTPPPIKREYELTVKVKTPAINEVDFNIRQVQGVVDVEVREVFK